MNQMPFSFVLSNILIFVISMKVQLQKFLDVLVVPMNEMINEFVTSNMSTMFHLKKHPIIFVSNMC